MNEALDLFYPIHSDKKRYWCGYAKFFSPTLPNRIGTPLIKFVFLALKGDKEARDEAVNLLQNNHTKVVSHLKGVDPCEVECYPTAEAIKAVKLLTEMY